MSYLRFTTEASDLIGTKPHLSGDAALEETRDKWIESKQFKSLVAFILQNWDAGNCVEFMTPVTKALIGNNEFELHQKLWTRTIRRQIDTFFRCYPPLKADGVNFEEILSFDHKGFNEFRVESYNHSGKASSFFLHRVVASLNQWEKELSEAKQDTKIPDALFALLKKLKKPKNDAYL